MRHRLIEPQRRRRKREDYRRWERLRAMELWQMDVMGGVKLEGGRELKIVTGIDDHSRFCVCAHLTPRATARPVCEGLAAMTRYGTPEQVLTDNGKVFTARFGRGSGLVLFDRLCLENGIRHLLTAPRSPTTTGKVERFHKTLRAELLAGRVFASAEEAQTALDAWVAHYNTERPHQGIGMVAPVQRFELAGERLEAVACLPEEERPKPALRTYTRQVSTGGRISFEGFAYHVGVCSPGEVVELACRDGLLQGEPPRRARRLPRPAAPGPGSGTAAHALAAPASGTPRDGRAGGRAQGRLERRGELRRHRLPRRQLAPRRAGRGGAPRRRHRGDLAARQAA